MSIDIKQELREAIKIAEDNNLGLSFDMCRRTLAELEKRDSQAEEMRAALRQLVWYDDKGHWFGNAYEDIDVTDIVGRFLGTDASRGEDS